MWYTASLLFKGTHGIVPPPIPLWQQVIVLLEADSEADARSIAERIGQSRAHSYRVSTPEPHVLKWGFERIELLFLINEPQLTTGVEVFARFLRESEVESMLTPFDDDRQDLS